MASQDDRQAVPASGWTSPTQAWSRRLDLAIGAALAALVLITRWPLRARTLNGWDAGSFALAVEEFDVLAQRPHAPGYPVYVAAGKLAHVVARDVNLALVLVSIVFSVASVVLLYRLLREVASVRASAIACVLLTFSPFFVFNGVIALSYTAEAFASVLVAWTGWRYRARPGSGAATALGASAAIAVGLRQSLAIYLAPLVLYCLWPRGPGRTLGYRRLGLATMAATITGLAWALPMWASTTQGFPGWRRAMAIQSEWVVFAESFLATGWAGIADRLQRLAFFLGPESRYLLLALLMAGLITLATTSAGVRWAASLRDPFRFLGWWVMPALAFYVLVFNGWDRGPTGYVLILLPPAYLLVALLLDQMMLHIEQHAVVARRRLPVLALMLVMLAPTVGYTPEALRFHEREVQAHDRWSQEWSALPERFPPNETAILTFYSWSHVKWYFPDYLVWGYFPIPRNSAEPDWELFLQTQEHRDDVLYYEAHERGPGQPEHGIPPWVRNVVVFDFQLAGENGESRRLVDDLQVREEFLPSGMRVLVFEPLAEYPTIESCFRQG